MLSCSFGFRPRRSAHDALQVLIDESWRGARWVAESDIADCFEAIPHFGLMAAIEERISDRHVLKLLRAMLRAGVMEDGAVRRSISGTPQGGVISPVLCNVYLHRFDRQWTARGQGVLVRYADDLLAMCKTKRDAENAFEALTVVLAELGLEPKQAKTRIVHLREGGEGVDFLGFHHRYVRGNTRRSRHLTLLVRWPSRQAMGHARQRVREITTRSRLRVPVEVIVRDLNMGPSCFAGRPSSPARVEHDRQSGTRRGIIGLPWRSRADIRFLSRFSPRDDKDTWGAQDAGTCARKFVVLRPRAWVSRRARGLARASATVGRTPI